MILLLVSCITAHGSRSDEPNIINTSEPAITTQAVTTNTIAHSSCVFLNNKVL